MCLRHKLRRKDGKEHRYWSIVENRRVSGGRTVQRHVLYLGEINDSQRAAWCRTIEAFDEGGQASRQLSVLPTLMRSLTLARRLTCSRNSRTVPNAFSGNCSFILLSDQR